VKAAKQAMHNTLVRAQEVVKDYFENGMMLESAYRDLIRAVTDSLSDTLTDDELKEIIRKRR
jgi:hypothetical protein